MKNLKVLMAGLMLCLVVSVNVASAQEYEINTNGEIYGLEVLVGKKLTNPHIGIDCVKLSFYSTYSKNEINSMQVDFYKGSIDDGWTGNLQAGSVNYEYVDNVFINGYGIVTVEDINDNIYKITIDECIINSVGLDPRLKFKFRIYLKGEYLSGSSDMSIQSSSSWQSNVLTFDYDPTATSIMTPEASENYTYKYYLLSGKETKTKPEGAPFICVTYKDGNPVASNKYVTIK